jgi:protein subunit release factor A
MKSIIVELRAAAGGEDSRLLIKDQLKIYLKYATRRNL